MADPDMAWFDDEGHGPGGGPSHDELADVDAWVESRRLVAGLSPAGQLEANAQTYAAILGVEGAP